VSRYEKEPLRVPFICRVVMGSFYLGLFQNITGVLHC
jgi:hypothetical protein